MRALIQRVTRNKVVMWRGRLATSGEAGLLVLLSITHDNHTARAAKWLAEKVALCIFAGMTRNEPHDVSGSWQPYWSINDLPCTAGGAGSQLRGRHCAEQAMRIAEIMPWRSGLAGIPPRPAASAA